MFLKERLKNKMTGLYVISLRSDMFFCIYLISEWLFPHTKISALTMIVLMGLCSIEIIRNKKIYLNNYFIWISIFIVQGFIAIMRNTVINQAASLKLSNTLILNIILIFLLYQYIMLKQNFEKMLSYFSFSAVLTTIVVIILSGNELFSGRLVAKYNILGESIKLNANYIALIAAFASIIYFYRLLMEKKGVYLVGIIWFLFVILLTGSRKGIIVILAGIIIMIIFFYPKKIFRNLFLISIVTISIYFLLMKVEIFYNIAGYRIEALINSINGAEFSEASLETRQLYIERGWRYFLEKPLNGFGLDSFRFLKGSYGTYSHNNYIELLVSGGVVGFILYYIYRIWLFLKLFFNKNKYKALLISILASQFITETGIVSYYDRLYQILFLFVLIGYCIENGKNYALKI